MSVIRSEIKQKHLSHYGLENMNLLLPELNTNEQILEWGQKIIDGEKKRIESGGTPLYNPGIAKVKVMYDIFKEGYQTQKLHQNATNRIQDEISSFRDIVDQIILKIWDEVEDFNSQYDSQKRIDKNKEYGIIYYYRKGEVIKEEDD